MEYYHRAIDKAAEIALHPKYGKHPQVLQFQAEFEQKRSAWKAKVDEQELVKAIRDVTDNALTNLSHAKSYFDSGHEGQAIEYLERAKDYAKQVEADARFTGRPEIPEFFVKFSTGAAAFEQHYRETVLAKEIKNDTSVCSLARS
jgi:hypothetical protein